MAKRYWINYLKEYIFTPSAPANSTASQTGTFKALVERVLNQQTAQSGKPWYQTPDTTLSTAATHIAEDASTAHGGSIQATQKDGSAATFRATYNFTGPGVTVSDDSVNNRTNVDIPGGGGGGGGSAHIIQEEGASLTARSRLNFRGVAATATDDSGNDRTNVDIRGNVHRSTTAPTSPVAGELWLDTNSNPATLRSYDGSTWVNTSGTPADSTVTDIKVAAGANIAKSKLANLAIDRADMATDRTVLVTCTSSTRPSNPATGQAIYETDTQLIFVNTGNPSTPVWTSITASTAYQATDFISGLGLTWDAGNTLGIETGAAYIPANSAALEVPTRLTRAVTFPASSTTFHYVYLFSNGGSPDIDISATAPAAPYRGTARTKSGDTSRRYLGAILPNGAATPAMYKWRLMKEGFYRWHELIGISPFLVLNDGAATTETTVNCAAVVPPTAFIANLQALHGHTASLRLGNANDNVSLSSANYIASLPASGTAAVTQSAELEMPLASNQTFSYLFSTAPAAGNGLIVRVQGYHEDR